MADAKLRNLEAIKRRLAKIPGAATDALKGQLKVEVADLVEAIKRAAPDDPTSDDPGHLRDSVHAYDNPDRVISMRILADAKDRAGKFIGSNVEQGHRAVDGKHVAARPFFWPTYRARKKGMKTRLSKAARTAIRQAYED